MAHFRWILLSHKRDALGIKVAFRIIIRIGLIKYKVFCNLQIVIVEIPIRWSQVFQVFAISSIWIASLSWNRQTLLIALLIFKIEIFSLWLRSLEMLLITPIRYALIEVTMWLDHLSFQWLAIIKMLNEAVHWFREGGWNWLLIQIYFIVYLLHFKVTMAICSRWRVACSSATVETFITL